MAKVLERNKKRAVRVGRPPQEMAGEVEERILDAARAAFLEHGLAGASVDEIARLAHAGKSTIYARFPSKEALFEAMAVRNGARVMARWGGDPPKGATLEERLVNLGTTMLERLLTSDAIEFMRLTAAESGRFPNLPNVGQMMRERAAQAVVHVLSDVADSGELLEYPALAPEQLATTARFFMDLVVARLLLRAVFGESRERLRAEIAPHVAASVPFFLAGCRQAPMV